MGIRSRAPNIYLQKRLNKTNFNLSPSKALFGTFMANASSFSIIFKLYFELYLVFNTKIYTNTGYGSKTGRFVKTLRTSVIELDNLKWIKPQLNLNGYNFLMGYYQKVTVIF